MNIERNDASISPASFAKSITVNTATGRPCRGIYIGVAGDYDFAVNATTWVAFKGCVAGSVIPVQAVGARDNSDESAPAAGEIVFLY